MAASWTDAEPGWERLGQELRCVARRARKRWLMTLLVTIAVTALVVAWRARTERRYEASIVIRVEEHSFDNRTRPPASGAVTDYLYDISLSRVSLRAVADKYDLYGETMSFDENLAIEEFHEDIAVEVVQNYFLLERFIENPVRSARIVLTYTGSDPEQTLAVVRELGGLIANEQTRTRQLSSELTHASAADMARALGDLINAARREQVRLNLVREKTPLQIVQLRRVTAEIEDLAAQLERLTQQRNTLALRNELEQRSMGLKLAVVDNGRPARMVLAPASELALWAALAFLFSLPLAAAGVGTLDLTIRDRDSIRLLGMTTFGHIPAFPGDDFGAYNQRTPMDRTS